MPPNWRFARTRNPFNASLLQTSALLRRVAEAVAKALRPVTVVAPVVLVVVRVVVVVVGVVEAEEVGVAAPSAEDDDEAARKSPRVGRNSAWKRQKILVAERRYGRNLTPAS